MKREDVIAAGMEVHDVQHSMKRRTPWHDYSRKGTYMITLVVRDRDPLFGVLKGSLETSVGNPPHVEFSALAAMIEQEEVRKIRYYYPQVEVWKLCIMPDHLHMILRVNEDLGAGKHLGHIVRGFKTGCSRAWWSLTDGSWAAGNAAGTVATAGRTAGTVATAGNAAGMVATAGNAAGMVTTAGNAAGMVTTVPSGSPEVLRPVLFEKGYNDKILLHEGQLENWKRYLDDNPRRLMTKRKNPGLFTVLTGMEVVGEQCQIVGNRFLLDVPDKMAVIVHRRYTDEENARLKEEWLACGERGGVLVSAAISPKEKEVLREAMNRGYNIILLRENGFPKLYKPSGEAFDACADGRLLQISPWEFHMERKTITRTQCLHLNAMAERIVARFS